MIKSIFRQIGGLVASVSPIIGLMIEVPEPAPIWHQLVLWGGFATLTVIGYWVYKAAGGQFRLRELFDE